MSRIVMIAALAAAFAAVAEDAAPVEAAEAPKRPAGAAAFTTLPLCRLVEGEVEVRKAANEEWAEAEEGRFYPLGASYRTGKNGRLVLAFGPESTVELAAGSEVATRLQVLGEAARTVVLVGGTVTLKLPDNLPEGAFFVTTMGFTAKNPAGESRFTCEQKGDGEQVTVRCLTGSVGLGGRHFDIPAMHSADEVVIRTSHDHLVTFLYGTRGDYLVKVDQGVGIKEEIGDDGQMKRSEEKRTLDWRLSPATRIVINRAVPSIGERMSVHTMAFDAAGERKSECYFCEGRAEVNSGELVVADKMSAEEIAKRAAEATETTAATDVEEKSSDSSADTTSSSEE